MPSSPPRRAGTRRSPRAAAAPSARALPPAPVRPLTAPFAAVFGLLVAAEDLYLARLLEEPEPGRTWVGAALAALALVALAGSALVLLGRGRGWLVLTLATVPSVLLLLGVALLFGVLGDGGAVGWALLLLTGPVGCLVLAVRRPIREWTRPRRGIPPPATARPDRGRPRGR
ncbi:hypothetical protein [Geodermatophilus saharensis]|nr:hypothetical protein [Geodermatophilus saharensis]